MTVLDRPRRDIPDFGDARSHWPPTQPSTQAVAPGPSSKEPGVIDTATALPDAKEIYRMTAEAAYYLAEKRNFAPGHEQEDWEAARAEVMAQLEKRKS